MQPVSSTQSPVPFIADIVDQHSELAASLWVARDNAVGSSSFRLADLLRLDERIEANIDGLRIAEASGWSASVDDAEQGGAGDFFVAGVLALESDDLGRFDRTIELAYAAATKQAVEPYHPALRSLARACILVGLGPPDLTPLG